MLFRTTVLALLGVVAAPALAGPPLFTGNYINYRQVMTKPMFPALIDPFELDGTLMAGAVGKEILECNLWASVDGVPVSGVKFDLTGALTDLDQEVILEIDRVLKTDESGYGSFRQNINFEDLQQIKANFFASPRNGPKIQEFDVKCGAISRKGNPCKENASTACLNDGRYKVTGEWDNGTASGPIEIDERLDDEVVIILGNVMDVISLQVFDGCPINQHWWVFYAATTNVGFDLTVTDTASGSIKTYSNELGMPAPAVTDTAAFATCP